MNHQTSHHRTDFHRDKRPGIDPGQTYLLSSDREEGEEQPDEGEFLFEPVRREGERGKPLCYRITRAES